MRTTARRSFALTLAGCACAALLWLLWSPRTPGGEGRSPATGERAPEPASASWQERRSATPGPSAGDPSAAAPTGSAATGLVVRVRDAAGAPAVGAEVRLVEHDPDFPGLRGPARAGDDGDEGEGDGEWDLVSPRSSDADGVARFSPGELANLVLGAWMAFARLGDQEGYTGPLGSTGSAEVTIDLRGVEDPLPGRGAIAGRVIDPTGLVTGCEVWLLSGIQQCGEAVASGPDGRFALRDLPPGTYSLSVTPFGTGPEHELADVAVSAGAVTAVQVVLDAVVGRLLLPPGISGEVAELAARELDCGRPPSTSPVVSAERGEYRLVGVARGRRWEIEARVPGFASGRVEVVVGPGISRGPDLRVGEGIELRGRLVSQATGRAVAGEVELEGLASAGHVTVGPEGAFLLRGVPRGRHLLRVTAGGRLLGHFPVWVGADSVDLGDVPLLDPPAQIRVRVIGPGGQPEPGAVVWADRPSEGGSWTARCDPAGIATIEVWPGRAAFRACSADQARISLARTLDVEPEAAPELEVVLELGLRSGSIACEVAPEGELRGGTLHLVRRCAHGTLDAASCTAPASTSCAGRYRGARCQVPWLTPGVLHHWTGLLPGTWVLVLGEDCPLAEVEVEAGRESRLALRLPPHTPPVRLRLEGIPRPCTIVVRWPSQGHLGGEARLRATEQSGDLLELGSIPPGPVVLQRWHEREGGWVRHESETRLAPGQRELVLRGDAGPSGAVEARLPPVARFQALFAAGAGLVASSEPDETGLARIDSLPPGTYRVLAAVTRDQAWEMPESGGVEVVVRAGETARLSAAPVSSED